METELGSKKNVSIRVLTISQLLIYYPLIIVGWFYRPPLYVYNVMENFLLKVTGLHFRGSDIYLLTACLLSNILAITFVFKIIFSYTNYFYTNKNAFLSVFWNFVIQVGTFLFFLSCLIIAFRLGATKDSFGGVLTLLIYCGGTFFIGTIGFYLMLSKITNKGGI